MNEMKDKSKYKVDKLKYIPGTFCGLLSSFVGEEDDDRLKDFMIDIIKQNGCIIYIYNNNKELEEVKKRLYTWNINSTKYIKNGQLVLIKFKKRFIDKGYIKVNQIINYYEKVIDKCRRKGYEKIVVKGLRDVEYNTYIEYESIYLFHQRLKVLAQDKQIMIFTKYILGDFFKNNLDKLAVIHDMFVINDEQGIHLYITNSFEKIDFVFKYLKNIFDDKYKLYKEKKKLELLNELILKVSYKKNEKELLNTAIEKICKFIGAGFGYVIYFQDNQNKNISGEYNLPNGFSEYIKLLDFTEYVSNNQIGFNLFDERLINKYKHTNHHSTVLSNKYGIKAKGMVPILDECEKVVGVLMLFAYSNNYGFIEYKSFLETVGNVLYFLLDQQQKVEKRNSDLLRAERLKVLGELAGGVCHDFNNILTTIIGFVQMIRLSKDDDEIKRYLDVIYSSALDGKAIVEKIRNFTKKRDNLHKDVYNVNQIVKSVIEMTKPRWKSDFQCRSKRLDIITELNSECSIYCNEHEIKEAILNIILNALDAMENGGKLWIKTYDKEDRVYIEIKDNGEGMSNYVKERIFEPFFSTKEVKGTGLGLSMTKDIIDEYNAHISVESKLGEGSKFTLDFKCDFRINEDKIKEEHESNFESIKALVVDDKIEVAKSIAALLNSINIKADFEVDSQKVIKKVLGNDYDIVISDLSMDKMNGIELAKELRKQIMDIKFILMTGWPGGVKDKDKSHIDYVLEKPCTIEELTEAVEKTLHTNEVHY